MAIVGVGGALCGVAVAGLVAWMGGQIIFDALLRLSDTADIEASYPQPLPLPLPLTWPGMKWRCN